MYICFFFNFVRRHLCQTGLFGHCFPEFCLQLPCYITLKTRDSAPNKKYAMVVVKLFVLETFLCHMFHYQIGFYFVGFKLCFPSFQTIQFSRLPITIHYCPGLWIILNTLSCYMQFCFPSDNEWIKLFQKNPACPKQ
jgi:hypothetical protein